MTSAAEQLRAEGGGARLLEDPGERRGRYLTELDAGRWHDSLREFEHSSQLPGIVGELLGTQSLRFFMDHIFLKEPGSLLRTAYHQDAPYFPFEGEQAAVCWVTVDSVSRENGAMSYVRGSHRWPEYKPSTLITNDPTHKNDAPALPDILKNQDQYDIVSFPAEPGDVIIHHPRTVHGSSGNVSTSSRRLAASIRYIGDDVRWTNKATLVPNSTLISMWDVKHKIELMKILPIAAGYLGRRVLRLAGMAQVGSRPGDYEHAMLWSQQEMRNGDSFDARDVSRCAFPVVWSSNREEHGRVHRQLRSRL